MSSPINRMFASIAPRYDVANDILSLGLHRLWRQVLLKHSALKPGQRALDCATGTGDLALLLKRRAGAQGEVVGVDFCEPMLEVARKKAARQNLNVSFVSADVLALPHEAGYFDLATVAFGVRNFVPPNKGLAQMARVLKPGGRLLVLEFGLPPSRAWRRVYGAYSRYFIPRIGGLITGNRSAYAYLHNTSTTFPYGSDFLRLMRQAAKFTHLEAIALAGGIAYLYIGVVAGPSAPAALNTLPRSTYYAVP